MRKPAMYLAGLCCVVAAMSLVLRDPTTLFGGKAAEKTAAITQPSGKGSVGILTKKIPAKIVKVLPHKQTQINDGGTDAHTFANVPAAIHKQKPTVKAKLEPPAKPKVTLSPALKKKLKTARKPAPALVHRTSVKHGAPKTQAQHFMTKKKTAVLRHKAQKAAAKTNEVKLYTNDPIPTSKLNTSGEQN